MKHKIFFLALAAIASLFSDNLLSNATPSSSMDGVVIILSNKSNVRPDSPRNPVDNPFYAELTGLGVLLVADSDWGDAEVTLSSIEGDYYQTIFDMADGSILLPVSGDTGDSYTLTISVCGLEFVGEFYL